MYIKRHNPSLMIQQIKQSSITILARLNGTYESVRLGNGRT